MQLPLMKLLRYVVVLGAHGLRFGAPATLTVFARAEPTMVIRHAVQQEAHTSDSCCCVSTSYTAFSGHCFLIRSASKYAGAARVRPRRRARVPSPALRGACVPAHVYSLAALPHRGPTNRAPIILHAHLIPFRASLGASLGASLCSF